MSWQNLITILDLPFVVIFLSFQDLSKMDGIMIFLFCLKPRTIVVMHDTLKITPVFICKA
jgi:hypothetical protein